jgi:response regulator RpfG family c-di-GMP phosphodiesterase
MDDIHLQKDEAELNARDEILYIDDEENNLIAFKAALRRDFNVFTAISAGEAYPILKEHDIKVVISDQRMPKITGVQFFAKIKEDFPEPIRILLTGYTDLEAVIAAINTGEVHRYLTKPWDDDFVKSVIDHALEVFMLRRDNKRLMEELKRANSQLEFYLRQKLLS